MAVVQMVDDDPAIVEILTAYLTAEGHAVISTEDGLQAVPLLATAQLAILDWMLPGMSGVDLTAYARREFPQLPVLLLTARGEVEDCLEDSTPERTITSPNRSVPGKWSRASVRCCSGSGYTTRWR
ncbi:hypothetical protein GCM10008955_30280 [Deinococcus malanensis]|uniref:Response regulatory domain-containing protein n=1 Tax=Deinococcus malanensis TaxID=1706855 RepID=A0ABQ2F001_9DEIO|nr:response regulator [Deinococcus malanensis]GGK34148.1 hypothetical protein GCM10008955_30280 [Deinococcus malanensis]